MSQFPPAHRTAAATPAAGAADGSPMAVASLILGILGFLTCGLTGLLGAVLGIVALVAISRTPGRHQGQGLAIAGVVVSAASLMSVVFYGVLASAFMPQLAEASGDDAMYQSVARLQTVAGLTELYGVRHDDRLPPAHDWVGAIRLDDPHALFWPGHEAAGRAYAMNASLDRVPLESLDDPARTVLYFEARPGSPLAGGPELLDDWPRFFEGYMVVYANGDVEVVPGDELHRLVWEP